MQICQVQGQLQHCYSSIRYLSSNKIGLENISKALNILKRRCQRKPWRLDLLLAKLSLWRSLFLQPMGRSFWYSTASDFSSWQSSKVVASYCKCLRIRSYYLRSQVKNKKPASDFVSWQSYLINRCSYTR
uniref:Uncharacterized protein n=1 Tax=Zea mays TaxID=4577 RepID=A0A804RFN7_MAIZE